MPRELFTKIHKHDFNKENYVVMSVVQAVHNRIYPYTMIKTVFMYFCVWFSWPEDGCRCDRNT